MVGFTTDFPRWTLNSYANFKNKKGALGEDNVFPAYNLYIQVTWLCLADPIHIGARHSTESHVFDLRSQSWSVHDKRLPESTAYHSLARLRGNRLLLLGGEAETVLLAMQKYRWSDRVHLMDYDEGGDWREMAKMNQPRCTLRKPCSCVELARVDGSIDRPAASKAINWSKNFECIQYIKASTMSVGSPMGMGSTVGIGSTFGVRSTNQDVRCVNHAAVSNWQELTALWIDRRRRMQFIGLKTSNVSSSTLRRPP